MNEAADVGDAEEICDPLAALEVCVEYRVELCDRCRGRFEACGFSSRHRRVEAALDQFPDSWKQNIVGPGFPVTGECAACGVRGQQRRIGIGVVQILEDHRRIADDRVAVDQDRPLR